MKTHAEDTEAFQKGLSLATEGKFNDAVAAFQLALQKYPSNLAIMTDLAMAEFQAGSKGWAVAHLTRVLFLDPQFATAKEALKFIKPQLELREIPHEILWSETMHEEVFKSTRPSLWIVSSAIFLLISTWAFARFWKARSDALQSQTIAPSIPWTGTFATCFFVICSVLALLNLWDEQKLRALVGAPTATVLAAPDEKAPLIYEVYAGSEVFVQESRDGWLQVTYPGGLTGWSLASQFTIINQPLQN